MNLKEIVFRSDSYGIREASIYIVGPRNVTAQHIILPPSVKIIDTTQHIANLTEPIDLRIGLKLERSRGYRIKTPNNFQDGSYPTSTDIRIDSEKIIAVLKSAIRRDHA